MKELQRIQKLPDEEGQETFKLFKKFSDAVEGPDATKAKYFEYKEKDEKGEERDVSFDPGTYDVKNLPDMIKHLTLTRFKIKHAAHLWIGTTQGGGTSATGAVKYMTEQLTDRSKRFSEELKSNLVEKLLIYGALTDDLEGDPFATERKRLLEMKHLIQKGINLVEELPDP